MSKKDYEQLAMAIIRETDRMMGPVAIVLANTVRGLKASIKKAQIKGDSLKVISQLIEAYRAMAGDVALTLAKKAAAPILKKNPGLKVPEELK